MIGRQWLSWLMAILALVWVGTSHAQTAPDPYAGLQGQQIQFFCGGCSDANQTAFRVLLDRFEARTGAKVVQVVGQCGVTQLEGQVQSKNVTYGLYEFCGASDSLAAQARGFLEKLDKAVIPVGVLLDGHHNDYIIGITPFAENSLYDLGALPASGKRPTRGADFFNTKDFPGKRCIHRNPQISSVLELALLADGVNKNNLYPLDMERALKKLGTIRQDTIFVATSAQAYQALLSGQCAMYIAANGAAGNLAKQNPDKKLFMPFGDAITMSAEIGIPKGAPNPRVGQAVLRWFLTDLEGWEQAIQKTPYVPAFKNPPRVSADLQPWVLLGKNLDAAARARDERYWEKNAEAIIARFNEWLASGK